jgi:hypothetical protein
MQSTLNLLDDAIKVQGLSDWAAKLGLSKRALYTARDRGHLSPAIAGALAEELGQDPKDWMVVAALESERDSACKARMIKRIGAVLKRYFVNHTKRRAR